MHQIFKTLEFIGRHAVTERMFRNSGAVIERSGANRAHYDLCRERVVVPLKEQFPSAPSYYQTVPHEFGHWNGHSDRLNRSTLTKGIEVGFSSRDYPREELRVEISSMITGDPLQIGHDPTRLAACVGSRIQALKDDPREIYLVRKGHAGHERLPARPGPRGAVQRD